MDKNLKYFISVAVFTIATVYGMISLMQWAVNAPGQEIKEPVVYMSKDGKMFTVVNIVALKDVNESITIVEVDTFKNNYYKLP